MKFNTAISQMMIFTNHCYKVKQVTRETAEAFAKVLAPFAPHLAEELWQIYGNNTAICQQNWPVFNKEFLIEDSFEYPVSFNGKMRFKLELPSNMAVPEIEKAALEHEMATKWIEGKQIVKIIVVPKKIINVVVK